MRNVLRGFILLVIVLALGGCSSTSVQKETTVKSEDKAVQPVEWKGQNLTDITKLATPDQIVYLHDGVETIYQSDDKRFKNIIQLNNARQKRSIDACKCMVDDKEIATKGEYLIYKYTKTHYVPVYFGLVPPADKIFNNWAINYYGSNSIPANEKDDRLKVSIFGGLAPADELLAYLKSKS